MIETLLARHGLPSGALVLELSESDPRIPLDELERRLVALRRLGVRIALDGFGSGYAAISALRRLPVDVLRLDRGLVDGVVESARLHKITAGLLRIASDLGMQSVADGVDLPEQVLALRSMGCTHGQGMAFSGPLDEHRLRRALTLGALPGAGRGRARSRAVVLSGSGLPVRHGGAAGPDSLPIRHCAQIVRPLSHPLDTRSAPGGGSVPCAPEFSYLESASAEAGPLTKPSSPHRRAPLACHHGTRGFLLHSNLTNPVKTLSFEKRRR